MEVERKYDEMKFKYIADGECFIDSFNRVCIKINYIIGYDDIKYNAVDAINGIPFHYSGEEKVTAVKAKLVIE